MCNRRQVPRQLGDKSGRDATQSKAYPSAAWIPILVTTAEPHKQPNQVQNWINVLDHLFHLIDKFTAIKAFLVLNKKILDLQLLELASRHGAGKNVNQQNVNQRRSPDDAERLYYRCSCFPVGTFKECLEDVILRAAQMEQIVEKVCEERLNTGAALKMKGRSSKTPQKK
ncbi:hypothetical protein Bca101_094021 [Brassica carinata]